ncbi:MAG: RNB domain-containing ribonuclease, partial [Xanthobacteraceae bacterium]
VMPQRLEAHRLIEEFMILANVAAAESCERAKVPLIYRVHDEPSPEKLNALREFLGTIEISLPKGGSLRPDGFNRILTRVKGRDVERLVNEVVLRTQAQAEYSSENFGHFGLNLRRYAHFTSPIRRYADLIVHRALIRALKLGADGLPDGADMRSLAEIAANISATERRAMKAERETADRLIAHFLADRVGAIFDGHISGVTRAGLFVELDETGADGFIPARSIGEEYFRFHEAGRAFVGRSATHRLGDPVTVELVEAAPVAGALRFRLVDAHGGRSAATTKRAGHQQRHDPKSAAKSARGHHGHRGRSRR